MSMDKSYIHLFNSVAEYEEARNNNYYEPWVSYTEGVSGGLAYNKTEHEKLLGEPLTLKVISAGTIVWKAYGTAYTTTIEYSTDSGETWTSITSNTGASAPSISVNAGDTAQFRGGNATYCSNGTWYNTFSGSTAKFEVEGNIMSLINSTNFATATTLASSYTFYRLFFYCTGLTSVENLVLPATNLINQCYSNMFVGCTSLTIAPVLPATTLAGYCYSNMFGDCTSLTTAPELPAATLAYYCYHNMFNGCTGLTAAPALPATTLAENCYDGMFWGCTSLRTTPQLPATTLEDYCYRNMFTNCTGLTTVPELPATTLTTSCYEDMFNGCASLNYIKCLATDISVENCTYGWVSGVASTGTFVKNSNMSSWTSGKNGIPSNWTVQDA